MYRDMWSRLPRCIKRITRCDTGSRLLASLCYRVVTQPFPRTPPNPTSRAHRLEMRFTSVTPPVLMTTLLCLFSAGSAIADMCALKDASTGTFLGCP